MYYVFNYINLDIRILHTLMDQIDLCYTDTVRLVEDVEDDDRTEKFEGVVNGLSRKLPSSV